MNQSLLFFNINEFGYLPLIERLIGEGFSIVANDSVLLNEAAAAGVDVRPFHEATPGNISMIVDQELGRILNAVAKGIKLSTIQAAFASPHGQFLTHTGQDFFLSFQQLATQGVSLIETLGRWLETKKIGLLVVGAEGPNERTMIRYAQTKSIPTLLLDSLEAPWHTDDTGFAPISEHIATLGPATELSLRKNAEVKACIFAAGLPHFDGYIDADSRWTPGEARERLGLKQSMPTVLACPDAPDFSKVTFPGQAQKLLTFNQTLIHSLCSMGVDVQLVVLPDSAETGCMALSEHELTRLEDSYKNWISKRGLSEVQVVRKSTPELMQAVDVVVTFGQKTTVLEALLSRRPVIVTECQGNSKSLLGHNTPVTFLEDRQSLSALLHPILNNPEAISPSSQVPPELLASQDRGATERLYELILDLTSGKYSRAESINGLACMENPILSQLYEQIAL
ncbi:glycosyltransferase family 4 protein [bacterium]|nr:glycosyltransferase family 4 protein [bacterium]